MGRQLVIVESPAKVKSIGKYLGSGYIVKSSIGHIRDLPVSGEKAKAAGKVVEKKKAAKETVAKDAPFATALSRRMGIDPEHDWAADYQVIPGKEKVLTELRAAAKDAETIWLATDLDREGEAIAWHLKELLGGKDDRYRRVTFAEITKKAITAAFEHPSRLNTDRVNAQQTRRFLDRLVGFMVSPLLWKKVARGLSAGRVQSVALRLVVEREREIRAFVPEEYWEIAAKVQGSLKQPFQAKVTKQDGKAFTPVCKADADAALADLKNAKYLVADVEEKPAKEVPKAPFITSTLQQAASVRFGFSVKRTMALAQGLYEAGYITYMRTDSTNLSADAITACRTYISEQFGPKYLPAEPKIYASAGNAQEAHEAIRPTEVRNPAKDLVVKDEDQRKLYELIWRQFVACQMPPAEYDTTGITITAGRHELRARGRVLRFDGFYKVLPPPKDKDEEPQLPKVSVGETLSLLELLPTQHYTKPPARFSEASLVRELTKRGIGRPSTYAAIISTIQDRGYVKLEKKRLFALKIGEVVSDRLLGSFPEFMDYSFTASLEGTLDEIAEGKQKWKPTLDVFYKGLVKSLGAAEKNMPSMAPLETSILCPKCQRPMLLRTGPTGMFLGCSGYGVKDGEACTCTLNLAIIPDEIKESAKDTGESDEATEEEAKVLKAKRRCPICKGTMDAHRVDGTTRLHICGNHPICAGFEIEKGAFGDAPAQTGTSFPCDRCGNPMHQRTGRFGPYFLCSNEECKNTRKVLKNGEPAPPRAKPISMPELPCTKGKGHFVLRDGASGLFLASNEYPKIRETRNPAVADLKRHAAELEEKHRYLALAPEKDPDGNPVILRFSKKTKQQYVASEKDDKPTGWAAFWTNGAWVVSKPESKAEKEAK